MGDICAEARGSICEVGLSDLYLDLQLNAGLLLAVGDTLTGGIFSAHLGVAYLVVMVGLFVKNAL